MAKSKIFLFILLSFVSGVAGASFITPLNHFILFIVFIILLVILFIGFSNLKLRIICFCVIGFLLGFWRFFISQPVINQQHIAFYNGQEISFEGRVTKEPDVRKEQVKLTIKVNRLKNLEKSVVVHGKVLVTTALYPEYQYGDLLRVTCQLKTPERVEDFSYDRYLARYGIYSVCYHPKIEFLAQNQGSVVFAYLYRIKNIFVFTINRILPEPQASFLGGLLLGAKRGIPADLMENFNRTGTTHIVAISGYNITIIAVLLLSFCKNLGIPRKKSFWLILITLLFFVLICGAQSSVVRAATMGGLILFAKQLGRLSRITNALILTAVIMLLINPKVLIFDAGFQLSFLATIGLVYLSPLLEKIFFWLPSSLQIKESFQATFSATIFTAPIILFQFERFSIFALLVNVLILPIIPFCMGIGFLAGLFSIIWFPLGQIFAWLDWLILTYIIRLVEFFSKFSFAAIAAPKISWTILVFSYLLLVLGMRIIYQKQNRFYKKRSLI